MAIFRTLNNTQVEVGGALHRPGAPGSDASFEVTKTEDLVEARDAVARGWAEELPTPEKEPKRGRPGAGA